ncbi:11-beta-hydroxysteroid dehydrogenase-like 5 [Linum perenne]
MGAKHVMIVAADVVKEDDCRRFVDQTVSYYGRVYIIIMNCEISESLVMLTNCSHLDCVQDINFWGNVYPTYVALPHLHQTNGRIVVNAAVETWLPLPRMSLYAAAKAAVINFYETLRYEVSDEIGVTIATHGWVGGNLMSGGKFMLEEGAEMQWREEREGSGSSGHLENYAKMIVSGACRGNQYVKCPSWYDIFLLYRFFAPGILNWTVRQVLASHGARRTSLMGTGRPLLEGSPSGSPSAPRNLIAGPVKISSRSPVQMQKLE